jgi:hypothetical protein
MMPREFRLPPVAGVVADTGPRWWNPTRLSHEPLRSRTAQFSQVISVDRFVVG